MSSSISIFSMLASLAFMFILIDQSLASNLDNVCSKTDDKNLCKNIMKEYSGSLEDSDYGTLCKNALDVAYNTTFEVVKRLIGVTDLPRIPAYNYLFNCIRDYGNVLFVLYPMKGTIKDSDYKHIEDQIRNVTEQVKQCNNDLKVNEGLQSDYNRLTNELKIFCEAITSSAKYWKGGDK